MIAAAATVVLVLWHGPLPGSCQPLRTRILHRHVSVSGRSGNAGDVAGTLEAAVVEMQEAAAARGADLVAVTETQERRVSGRGAAEHRVRGRAYVCKGGE